MTKALIYTRVSTEEQATSDRHSLKTQLSLCEKAIDDSGEYKLAPDGVCGCRYTAEHNFKKKISYYHCNRYKNNIPGNVKCMDQYVEMSNLENQVQEQFNRLQFTNDFIAKIEARLKIVYEEKKSSVTDEKSRIMQAKLSVESKLERAEHKLIDGVIDDESFERLKKTYREQIEDFENQIAKLDRSKNIKVDVIQRVLALTRDIGTSYNNAKPELKQLYLGLFWHHFLAKERKIVEAVKSPIVVALEEVGAITDATEDSAKIAIPSPMSGMDSSVINNTFRGAFAEDVRTAYEQRNDSAIYIPALQILT